MSNEEGYKAHKKKLDNWLYETMVLIEKNKWQTPEYEQYKNQQKMKEKVYVFHRADMWYPIEMYDDADAIKNAEHNPGTTKVENWKGEVIWEVKPSSNEQTNQEGSK